MTSPSQSPRRQNAENLSQSALENPSLSTQPISTTCETPPTCKDRLKTLEESCSPQKINSWEIRYRELNWTNSANIWRASLRIQRVRVNFRRNWMKSESPWAHLKRESWSNLVRVRERQFRNGKLGSWGRSASSRRHSKKRGDFAIKTRIEISVLRCRWWLLGLKPKLPVFPLPGLKILQRSNIKSMACRTSASRIGRSPFKSRIWLAPSIWTQIPAKMNRTKVLSCQWKKIPSWQTWNKRDPSRPNLRAM